MNFKPFGNELPGEGAAGGGRLPGYYPLVRQPSIYSLTFDELQSTMGGMSKDFGSMNMDELLKNIWTAEETQNMGSSFGGIEGVGISGGHLQRQGSLTLPRTLSLKTVDDVWRDISKEYGGEKNGSGVGGSNLPQRQQTLGEITLEEFLLRAGVVMEEAQLAGKPDNNGLFGDWSRSLNNPPGLGIGFQQTGRGIGLLGNRMPESSNQIAIQSAANLPLNINGVRSTQQPLLTSQPQQQQQQPIFPKQPIMTYGAPMPIPSSCQLGSPGIRGGTVGMVDPTINGNLVQGGALQAGGMGMVGLGDGGVTVATGSPTVSSTGLGKSNGHTASVLPVPYMFNGGLRGRKSSAVEKVVERRQKRMIKNRESAARSRARKQAYTTELEAEVAKLKEKNQELQKKQAKIMDMQKNQALRMMNLQQGVKRRCLRRTQTGPW
ncbi:unnamed protein product [Ilex paraguariensis]|uniref:BZIP domain-containing protein n=1 Tax=Ilex paraguariensis TaxID=185542 RepID=A0ABC8QRH3_9AQUA